jgi:rhamnosyltransferase
MTSPAVSIVLPTFNGMATLPAVLDAIDDQRDCASFEIVAIDSGSTDGTVALLERRAHRVLHERGRFDHGATRNRALAACHGEVLVLMVQDAVPADARWLMELTAPLREDASLSGAYARQVPRADASALTRHFLGQWAASSPEPRVQALAMPREFLQQPPLERYLRCVFDDVCSAMRRDAWERLPLAATRIAEDAQWARDVLLSGGRIAYVPRAVVVHSHERGAWYELGRTYLAHRRLRELFGVATVPTMPHLAHAVWSSIALHWRLTGGEGATARARGIGLALAWPAGPVLGARARARGVVLQAVVAG